MDISIYCRKPSRLEQIDRELVEKIEAIVADLHARLDELAKEYQPKPVAIACDQPRLDRRALESIYQRQMNAMYDHMAINNGMQAAGFGRYNPAYPYPGSVLGALVGSDF